MYDNGDNGDSVSNSVGWYEITVKTKAGTM